MARAESTCPTKAKGGDLGYFTRAGHIAEPFAKAAFALEPYWISDVVQTRTTTPYAAVPGRFGGRRVTTGSGTFRIEAEGLVGGDPKARIIAIVQKTSSGTGGSSSPVSLVSWRFEPPRSAASSQAKEDAKKP